MWDIVLKTFFVAQVSKKDFEQFDYILCMDESNLSDLKVINARARLATSLSSVIFYWHAFLYYLTIREFNLVDQRQF